MKLRVLEAVFLRIIDSKRFREEGEKLEGAQGIIFLCPKCYAENDGRLPVR